MRIQSESKEREGDVGTFEIKFIHAKMKEGESAGNSVARNIPFVFSKSFYFCLVDWLKQSLANLVRLLMQRFSNSLNEMNEPRDSALGMTFIRMIFYNFLSPYLM